MGTPNRLDSNDIDIKKIDDIIFSSGMQDEIEDAKPINTGIKGKDKNHLKYNGLPYRGPVYDIDKTNIPIQKKQLHIKQFDLSKEKDLKEYENVCQQIADKEVTVSYELKQFYEGTWLILLRWMELYSIKNNTGEEFE